MSNAYLLLWLEGPFQSWGNDSRYGRRETLKFPTKSALCGLVCASMGARGEQTKFLNELANTKITVYAYSSKKRNISFLQDFQTVGNGYDSKDPFESLLVPKTSLGKSPNGTGSKITYRYYLQDASYAVVWELPEELAQEIAQRIVDPIYFVSLGRKNCIPSEWIYQGVFTNKEEAFTQAQNIAEHKQKICTKTILEGAFPDQGEVIALHDIPKQFGEFKKYSDRFVTIVEPEQ